MTRGGARNFLPGGLGPSTAFLVPILNFVSYALENFQGGLSSLQPTPGAATNNDTVT